MRRTLMVVAVLALVAIAAACGDDNNSSNSTTTTTGGGETTTTAAADNTELCSALGTLTGDVATLKALDATTTIADVKTQAADLGTSVDAVTAAAGTPPSLGVAAVSAAYSGFNDTIDGLDQTATIEDTDPAVASALTRISFAADRAAQSAGCTDVGS